MALRTASIFLIGMLLIPFMGFAQELNQKIIDPKYGTEILYGYCDRSGLEKGEFGKSFKEYYESYEPDKSVTEQLKLKQDGIEILVVLGTWCSDSKEQVPKFFKILDKIRFDRKQLQMVAVNSSKEAGLIDLVNYSIQKVPTFIIYRRGHEVGRIIETPFTTLENDLLMFFGEN
jgi:thiol-disulfide isomerase/thioredoxin